MNDKQTNVLIALVNEIKRLNDNIEEYNRILDEPVKTSSIDFPEITDSPISNYDFED